MFFDYSRYILWEITGATTLAEVDCEMITEDNTNRIKTRVRGFNTEYTIATVIMVDGFRIPVCTKKLEMNGKWDVCLGLRWIDGEELTAEEFLLKDKRMRLAYFGCDEE